MRHRRGRSAAAVYDHALDVGLHLRSMAASCRAWRFGLPWTMTPLGRLAERPVVGRYLRGLIETRNPVLAREAAAGG